MASYRRPKGAVVRPIPDWNIQNCGYGGIFNAFPGTFEQIVGLVNTSTAGLSLIVWDCTISVGRNAAATYAISNAIFWYIAQVPPPASTPCQSVDPFVGQLPAVIGNNINTSNLSPLNPGYCPLSGEGVWRWENNFPMAIVRPGYTHIVDATLTDGALGVGWIFEVANYA